jgi:bifunctional non-homologous end joining protein LigD
MKLTRLDQIWWPADGIRKRDVLDYYHAVAPALLPHLADRPFTIKRHYNGPRSPFEWIKDAPPELPEWIDVSPQPARSRGGALVRYPVVQTEAALLWMVDFGAIDLHVWPSRCDRPDRPDYVLFDLDPHGAHFDDVVGIALQLREILETIGLRSYAKTTGGDGLHVQVPINRRYTHEQTREFSRILAGTVARLNPGTGVQVDTKMNGRGQQLVAPYSVRPVPKPTVATPVAWDELEAGFDPQLLTIATVPERVERLGDLHEPVLRGGQSLRSALRRVTQ